MSTTASQAVNFARKRRSFAEIAGPPAYGWYKNAVIYQLHVRSFCDSTGDGVGDFNGLISKLDYLADLGVTALWLLPFYPSPLRDDGYDIADFTGVNPAYGTIEDVRRFVQEAHRRGLRVITELVVNHTSDQHPWFQRARRAPKGSPERDFYVWSDSADKYAGTRIIFKDFESSNWAWDSVAQQYYWHRFYSHQPDLNFANPAVRRAVLDTCSFWMRLGVDGMRLDAVPYLYEREGTSCENLPETHEFLRELRAHVDREFPGRMLLAEANQWPEDAIAYFGDDDECHMAFHFPLMPRLFMALRMEDRYPIVDIMEQTPPIPPTSQWAVFLRNHDELTLEMVTDEERDYMYRVYASDSEARINLGIRRRLAPLLGNNRRKIELMNGLLFSLPGAPIVYYGDEIGMGDNIFLGDRNGVRTPMQWNADRNAGFSRSNPQRLFLPVIVDPEHHYESVNVESQQANLSSVLWWMKRLIALRNRYPLFGLGSMRFVHSDNPRVLAYVREHEGQAVLVVANLSRFVQPCFLPIQEFAGRRMVEMFGSIAFPDVGETPYFLSLGPHELFWFVLEEPAPSQAAGSVDEEVPEIVLDGPLEQALGTVAFARSLERILPGVLPRRRWFASKSRSLRSVRITEQLPVTVPENALGPAMVMLAQCEFATGEPDVYALPLMLQEAQDEAAPSAIALVQSGDDAYELIDAVSGSGFPRALLELAVGGRTVEVNGQKLIGTRLGEPVEEAELAGLPIRVPKLEQSNSTIFVGDRLIFKMFRRLHEGENPELEIGRHLTERVEFSGAAPLAGAVEIEDRGGRRRTLAVVVQQVAAESDAWAWMLGRVGQYLERASAVPPEKRSEMLVLPRGDTFEEAQPPAALAALLGDTVEQVRLLGERTAEMHAALADDQGDPAFTPEAFSLMYQRSHFQSIRNLVRSVTDGLRGIPVGQTAVRELVGDVLASSDRLLTRVRQSTQTPLTGRRIRVHGDFHLGQALWTGRDFVFVDFEGEPLRSIGERRLKRTPLRDVAGMIRSFDYAIWTGVKRQAEWMTAGGEMLDAAAKVWSAWMARLYANAYAARLDALNPSLLGEDPSSRRVLLRTSLMEKVLYEVQYELNARPEWVDIPLRALREMLSEPVDAAEAASGAPTRSPQNEEHA